jgi:epoxyqueuosine reductase
MATEEIDIARASTAVQECLANLDVDIVGVAVLDDLKGGKLVEQALKLLPDARSIVTLAVEVYPEFLNLTSPEMITGAPNLNDLYDRHIDHLAGRLDRAVNDIARVSRKVGLKALPLSSRRTPTDRRTLEAVLSYKHAAEAAGLGKMGMSSLLVTYQFGPRIRLGVCLTEALLKSTANDDSRPCRDCNLCVSKCPSHALDWPEKGETYAINKFVCREYLEASGGCSECVKQCPVAAD